MGRESATNIQKAIIRKNKFDVFWYLKETKTEQSDKWGQYNEVFKLKKNQTI